MSPKFIQEDTLKTEMTLRQVLSKMWPFIQKHRGLLTLVMVTVLLYTVIGRFLPILFGYAIDAGIKEKSLSTVFAVAIAYGVLEVARAALWFSQSYGSAKLGNRVMFQIRQTVIDHVQRLPATYFDRTPSGRTVTRVTNDVLSLADLFNQGFSSIFVSVLEIVSIFVALTVLSWPMTAATVVMVPVVYWSTLVISKRIRMHFGRAKRKLATINAFTAESLNGIKIIQLYNRAEKRRQEFHKHSKDYRDIQLSTVKLFAVLWPILNLFNALTVSTALLLGAYFYQSLGLTVGELSAFVLLLQSFFHPVRVILERYNQFQNSLASADRIFNLLAEPQEADKGGPLPAHRLTGRIEFRNLSFRYHPEAAWAIQNINLTIEPGQSVALVGRTGSGKSTLISLLQKMYIYCEGDILIDGMSLNQIHARSLRRKIGVVQQDNFIFRGTIRSNITLNQDRFTEEQVIQAAKDANLWQLIQERPGGLDAAIEERGANLSVGEKQLIAFARVLAHDPDILILDEATANIDSKSEQLIQQATRKMTSNRTSIIIAHRLSTILDCDRIVVLEGGRIVETGTHSDLLAQRGAYYRLYTSQFKEAQASADL